MMSGRTIQVTDSRRERALAANPASKLSGASKTQARGGCSVHLLVGRSRCAEWVIERDV
jgi:hypothetical protein